MNLPKLTRETVTPSSRTPWFLCLTAIVAFMTYAAGLRDGLVIGMNADKPLPAAEEAFDAGAIPAMTVVITETTISPVTCKDIMEKFNQLPSAELLEQEGLLEQVGDCTLEALDEPTCGIRDPLGCVSYVWHAIVH